MGDIVEDLRATADDTDADMAASVAILIEKAADEIARLRLSPEERQAISWVCGDVADITGPTEDTLRALLERTK